MKTRGSRHALAALAGGLLLALPAVGWTAKGGVPAQLAECQAELAACLAEPCAVFPGDGQSGAPLSYTDNGDGTFTDDNTELVWEMKDAADGLPDPTNPHDVDNTYTWSATGTVPDGTVFVDFIHALNATEFGGHTDWRLPTVKELQSLVDYSVPYWWAPTVSPDLPGATSEGWYWSSTSDASYDGYAWYVKFKIPYVLVGPKDNDLHVRAVRGGW